MKRPLAGLRVLAVEQYGAGPYGTLLMSELGAEVEGGGPQDLFTTCNEDQPVSTACQLGGKCGTDTG